MTELQRYFPNQQIATLTNDLANVHTWDDFARVFLLGGGKSQNTNRSYLTACKQFYDFTGGLHPMQSGTPEWIESWYDSLSGDLNTRAARMAGLRYMYCKVCERFPFYQSPFTIMSESLKRKLSRTKRDDSQKDALSEKEYRAILRLLEADTTDRGLSTYSLFRLGCTSGLRAAELAGLTYGCISEGETITATFIGKGSKLRTVQIEEKAYRACVRAFRAIHGRKPQAGDPVFNSTATGRHASPGMSTATIGVRVRDIASRARAAGIIRPTLHVSPHTLRHTAATRLLSAGLPIDAVQRHLGHASMVTTSRYLHNAPPLDVYYATMAGEAVAG